MIITKPVFRQLAISGLNGFKSLFTYMEMIASGERDEIEIETETSIITVDYIKNEFIFELEVFSKSSETRFIHLTNHEVTFKGWHFPEAVLNTSTGKKMQDIFDLPLEILEISECLIKGTKSGHSPKFLIDVPRLALDDLSATVLIESLR